MKLSISIPDAYIPQLDARDTGRGRSDVLARILARYLRLVAAGLRQARPHPQDIDTVALAISQQLGGEGAVAEITDDPLAQITLVDAAEQQVARRRRAKGKE